MTTRIPTYIFLLAIVSALGFSCNDNPLGSGQSVIESAYAPGASLAITGVNTSVLMKEDIVSDPIELPFTSRENIVPSICLIADFSNVTPVEDCACADGKCSIRVQGAENKSGPASFSYRLGYRGVAVSMANIVSIEIEAINDDPTIETLDQVELTAAEPASVSVQISDVDNILNCSQDLQVGSFSESLRENISKLSFSGTAPACILSIPANFMIESQATLTVVVSDGTAKAAKNISLALKEEAEGTPPVAKPSPPLLSAAAISATQVNLAWTASSGPEPITYTVKRSGGLTSNFLPLNQCTEISLTTCNDTTVTGGVEYRYVVIAKNAGGTAESLAVLAATTALPTIPVLSAANVISNKLDLSWTASMGIGPIRYTVKRSPTSGSGYVDLLDCLEVSGSTCQDDTATPGTVYFYIVRARNAGGAVESGEISGTSYIFPSTPTLSTAVTVDSRIDLTWTASTGSAPILYTVKRSLTSGSGYTSLAACTDTSSTTCHDVTGTPGTTYYYVVSASNGGATVDSNEVSGKSYTSPSAPTITVSVTQDSRLDLSWPASNGTGPLTYTVKRSTTSGSGHSALGSCTGISSTTCNDTSGTNGTTYYYVVEAINPLATTQSAEASGIPFIAASSPQLSITQTQSSRLDLSWIASSGTSPISYTISRSSSSGGTFSPLAGCTNISTLTCSDTTVIADTTYFYKVSATNYNSAAASNQVSATAGIFPSATTLSAALSAPDKMDLSWPASTGSTPITYTVYRSTTSGSGFSALAACNDQAATSCQDGTSSGGTSYYYKVIATNFAGSTPSNQVGATPIATFSITSAALAGSGNIKVVWTGADGASSYQVKYANTSGGPYSSSGCSAVAPAVTCTVTGLTDGSIYYFMIEATNSSDGSISATSEISARPNGSIFNGWTHIKAVGAKSPAAVATDLSSANASITLTWAPVTMLSGTVSSYNLYRSTTSAAQNYDSPLATGISTAALSYTDTSASTLNTYYYTLAAVSGGDIVIPATVTDSEVSVRVPPDNMVLLHRWAANQEICTLMGKSISRNDNYRCTVATGATAPPGTENSGYVDLGTSLFVDAFEQGCNFTFSPSQNKCGSANGCIGILSNPNGSVSANAGDIYYSRRSGGCYINTSAGSGTTWSAATSTTTALRKTMASAAPGLPPFVSVSQVQASEVCSGQGIAGISGFKHLLKRREFILVAAWDASLSDAAINTRESGVNLDTTQNCNSNNASPQGNTTIDISGSAPSMAYDNNDNPSAKDTLPACLFGDCASSISGMLRSLRTGSQATRNCISRYGAQDLAGNVYEITSDQVSCNGTLCTGVPKTSNTADSNNDDFNGVFFDGNQGPNANILTLGLPATGKIQFPVGIPIVGAGFSGDGVATLTAAQFHGDAFFVTMTGTPRAMVAGGGPNTVLRTGRFYGNLLNSTSSAIAADTGFRCAIAAE